MRSMRGSNRHKEEGVTLIIGLIMLVLITLVVTTAFSLSTANLKSVGNMQVRDEAIAAANLAIEQVLSSAFTSSPGEEIVVDIDNDTKTDYTVVIDAPVCIRATAAAITSSSSVTLGEDFSTSSSFNTIWEIVATVTDIKSGATATVHQGARVLLTESEKNDLCD